MKKVLYAAISLVLVFTLIAVPMSVAADDGILTECKGKCDYCPTIVVPGILQSQTYMQTANGEDMLGSDGAPIMEAMDMKYFVDSQKFSKDILKVIPSALGMLLTGADCGLTKTLTNIMDNNVNVHYFNKDGTRTTPIKVQNYPYSVAESAKYMDKFGAYTGKTGRTQKDAALREVDVSEYGEIAGYDHLYFFCYESFGDIYDIAKRFNDYIALVKEQTGHDKVNLVFISLGGAVGTAYLDAYFNADDVNRIVFVAAAVDGTTVMSDVFHGNFTLTDYELLYTDFLPSLLGMLKVPEYEWLGGLASIVFRLLPHNRLERLQSALFSTLKSTLIGKMFARCSTMWALVPSSEYESLAKVYLSDPESAPLKAVTDKYYRAQCNNRKTISDIVKNTDVEIMNICGYGLDIPSILTSYYTETSDNIINTSSTSMGAKVAKPGETLGNDYKCAIDSTYISPDGMIDAGAGYLPDTTWYVKNQSHLKLQKSKDVIHFCVELLANKDIHDIATSDYPQFNYYRDSDNLYWLVEQFTDKQGNMNIEKLNAANPTEAQRAEFTAAYKEAVALKNNHHWDAKACDASVMRLSTIAREIGILSGNFETQKEYNKRMSLKNATDNLSDFLFAVFGTKSFWNF